MKLNSSMRQRLHKLMRDTVKCPAEQAAYDAAYAKVDSIIRLAMGKKYPSDEMLVLKKHQCMHPTRTVIVVRSAKDKPDVSTQFNVHPEVESPPGYPEVKLTGRDREAFERFIAAQAKLDDAMKSKRADYAALIERSSTLEQVVEAWPEAATAASGFAVASPDYVERVRADAAARTQAADAAVNLKPKSKRVRKRGTATALPGASHEDAEADAKEAPIAPVGEAAAKARSKAKRSPRKAKAAAGSRRTRPARKTKGASTPRRRASRVASAAQEVS